jgi:cyclophilin family peptidyl-prolyl cis-trans isomerase
MKALFVGLWLSASVQASPVKAPQRVILHTLAGDLVLALYPEAAPRTVAQFLGLVRNGVFDTTHFRRLEPGFVLQVGVAEDRIIPLNKAQKALLKKLPGEMGNGLKHHRGVLSMARYDGDKNSAVSSFSILLGDAPHLDGEYTIFGEIEGGIEVLQVLEEVPTNPDHTPRVRLSINYAEVAETPKELASRAFVKPIAIGALAAEVERQLAEDRTKSALPLGVVLAVIVLVSAAGAIAGWRMRSLLFLNALVGGFTLFCWLAPLTGGNAWLSAAVFLGTAALFRALSYFEVPGRQ